MRVGTLATGQQVHFVDGELRLSDGSMTTIAQLCAAEQSGSLIWTSADIRDWAHTWAAGPAASPAQDVALPTVSAPNHPIEAFDPRMSELPVPVSRPMALLALAAVPAMYEVFAILAGVVGGSSALALLAPFIAVLPCALLSSLHKNASRRERFAVAATLATVWLASSALAALIAPGRWVFGWADILTVTALLVVTFAPEIAGRLPLGRAEVRDRLGAGIGVLIMNFAIAAGLWADNSYVVSPMFIILVVLTVPAVLAAIGLSAAMSRLAYVQRLGGARC